MSLDIIIYFFFNKLIVVLFLSPSLLQLTLLLKGEESRYSAGVNGVNWNLQELGPFMLNEGLFQSTAPDHLNPFSFSRGAV